ncbi:MAG TPA: hypothetical protein VGD84_20905 [Pseudonocardiaceae bacterium]
MLSAIAIIPSAPVLVPELAGAAAVEVAELRAAMVAAVATLPPRWVAVGVGASDGVVGPEAVGTFAGFGVDVPVQLSPQATGRPVELPPCALIAGWIRAQAQPDAAAQVRVFADSHDSVTAVDLGRQLRNDIDQSTEPTGVLVVADGANTLTRLPAQVRGRVAFGVLAGLAEPVPRSAKELYRSGPYGVGYFAGVWQP